MSEIDIMFLRDFSENRNLELSKVRFWWRLAQKFQLQALYFRMTQRDWGISFVEASDFSKALPKSTRISKNWLQVKRIDRSGSQGTFKDPHATVESCIFVFRPNGDFGKDRPQLLHNAAAILIDDKCFSRTSD